MILDPFFFSQWRSQELRKKRRLTRRWSFLLLKLIIANFSEQIPLHEHRKLFKIFQELGYIWKYCFFIHFGKWEPGKWRIPWSFGTGIENTETMYKSLSFISLEMQSLLIILQFIFVHMNKSSKLLPNEFPQHTVSHVLSCCIYIVNSHETKSGYLSFCSKMYSRELSTCIQCLGSLI